MTLRLALGQGVTNFWEHGAAKEIEDGKRLSDAVKRGGVKLFIWSGLEPVSKVSKGKYTKVEHFDTKVCGGGVGGGRRRRAVACMCVCSLD
jgi:hypothetical protein